MKISDISKIVLDMNKKYKVHIEEIINYKYKKQKICNL